MIKIIFLFIILFQSAIFAQVKCESLFVNIKTDLELSVYFTEKYPDLSFITKNPQQFVSDIRDRYKKQKELNPKEPLQFDYTEVSLPVIKYAYFSLLSKVDEQKKILLKMRESPLSILFKFKEEKVQAYIEYLNLLLIESSKYLDNNSVSYLNSLEFLYFYTRAIGLFDDSQITIAERFYLSIDRLFQGFKPLSLNKEIELYKTRKFKLFQKKSIVDSFYISQPYYENAFLLSDSIVEDSGNLGAIIVPVARDIDRDILLRVLPTEISIVGVTKDIIPADGFVRPGGDFWMHDVRHEGARFLKIARYMESNQINRKKWLELASLQEKWFKEFEKEKNNIKDLNLKEAVDLVQFNYFHDRGFPMLPTVWLARKDMHVLYGLMFMLTISGQKVRYNNIIKNTNLAYKWMDDFFYKRLNDEIDFLENN